LKGILKPAAFASCGVGAAFGVAIGAEPAGGAPCGRWAIIEAVKPIARREKRSFFMLAVI
jgi:hypothetical protein